MTKGDLKTKKSDSIARAGETRDEVFSLPRSQKSPPDSPKALTNVVLNLQMSGAAINITPREKDPPPRLGVGSAKTEIVDLAK